MRSSLELANEILESLSSFMPHSFVAPWILSEKIEKIQDEAFLEGKLHHSCESCKEQWGPFNCVDCKEEYTPDLCTSCRRNRETIKQI